jgi:hypothetical protein
LAIWISSILLFSFISLSSWNSFKRVISHLHACVHSVFTIFTLPHLFPTSPHILVPNMNPQGRTILPSFSPILKVKKKIVCLR